MSADATAATIAVSANAPSVAVTVSSSAAVMVISADAPAELGEVYTGKLGCSMSLDLGDGGG